MLADAYTELVVAAKSEIARDVVTVRLRHPEGKRLADWTPGAHIDVVLPNGLVRQYSLCGDRWDAYEYQIGVLRDRSSRGGSEYIHDQLAVGCHVAVGAPRNNFLLVPANEYLFVAGGIGITAMLPMITQAQYLAIPWRLLYVGRSRASMAFIEELEGYGERVTVVARDAHRRPDLSMWLSQLNAGAKVYCCGPQRLLAAVEDLCTGGMPGRLRAERFVPADLDTPVRHEAFILELRSSGITLEVKPGQTLLEAINATGATILTSCRRGLCGTCQVAVIAGDPDHRDSVLDDDERAAGDCMFVCVSGSRSNRLVLDL
jgi:ferredoxin-NADP reductase